MREEFLQQTRFIGGRRVADTDEALVFLLEELFHVAQRRIESNLRGPLIDRDRHVSLVFGRFVENVFEHRCVAQQVRVDGHLTAAEASPHARLARGVLPEQRPSVIPALAALHANLPLPIFTRVTLGSNKVRSLGQSMLGPNLRAELIAGSLTWL